jgi:thioredoxin reductase
VPQGEPMDANSGPVVLIFAVGDVRHGSVKRVASAVGEGSVCIRLLHEYLALEVEVEGA